MPSAAPNRFQVRCDNGLHRVVLDPEKYWQRVKCPGCRARMDRYRFRRTRKWLLGKAPRSTLHVGTRFRFVALECIALSFVALMLLGTLLLNTLGDAWWPATILMFLGRWPWLVPGLAILLLALFLEHRRAVVMTLAGGVVGLFGILEFSAGTGRLVASAAGEDQIRVITYNIGGDVVAPENLAAMVIDWQPNILALQECGEHSVSMLRNMPGYFSDVGLTCLFTRYPIVRIDSLRREAFANAGGAAWVKRYRLRGPDGEFDFTNLHLDTPRKAFEALMDGDDGATATISEKTAVRDLESRLARRWVDQGPGPSLVAGDFNMPSESAIYRRHWGSMSNGFSRAGRGFGYSRHAGWIQLRIDHVLADDAWVVQSARLLENYGSDHLPMLVDVARRTP